MKLLRRDAISAGLPSASHRPTLFRKLFSTKKGRLLEQERTETAGRMVETAKKSTEIKDEAGLFLLAFEALKNNKDAAWVEAAVEKMPGPKDAEEKAQGKDIQFLLSFISKAGKLGVNPEKFLTYLSEAYHLGESMRISWMGKEEALRAPKTSCLKALRETVAQIKMRRAVIDNFSEILSGTCQIGGKLHLKIKRIGLDDKLYLRIAEESRDYWQNGAMLPLRSTGVCLLLNKIALVGPVRQKLLGKYPELVQTYGESGGKDVFKFDDSPAAVLKNASMLNEVLLESGIFIDFDSEDGKSKAYLIQVNIQLDFVGRRMLIEGEDGRLRASKIYPENIFHNNSLSRWGVYTRLNKEMVVYSHETPSAYPWRSILAENECLRLATTSAHEMEHSIQNTIFPPMDSISGEEGAYLSEIVNMQNDKEKTAALRTLMAFREISGSGNSQGAHERALSRIFANNTGRCVAGIEKKFDEFYLRHIGISYSGLSAIAKSFTQEELGSQGG